MNSKINRLLYIGFVVLGLYYLVVQKTADAIPPLGIALAFDPFDPSVPLPQRTVVQKSILYVHLAVVLLLVARQIFTHLPI